MIMSKTHFTADACYTSMPAVCTCVKLVGTCSSHVTTGACLIHIHIRDFRLQHVFKEREAQITLTGHTHAHTCMRERLFIVSPKKCFSNLAGSE